MKTSINALHHQETDWLRELEFYNDELGILLKRLEEVVTKNSSAETLAQAEHFQTRFILLEQQYKALHKENSERSARVNQMAKAMAENIEDEFTGDQDNMNARMSDFVNSFQNNRLQFNRFLSKVL